MEEAKTGRIDENLEMAVDGRGLDRAKSGSNADLDEENKLEQVEVAEKRPRLSSIRLQEESEKQAKLIAGVCAVNE